MGNGGDWPCCSSTNKCGEGEGDCDSDAECQSGLICGKDNCVGSSFLTGEDCCTKPTSSGSGCNGGDWTCCSSTNKCGEGEGDCDSDAECQSGLICGKDNCVGSSFLTGEDCCTKPTM